MPAFEPRPKERTTSEAEHLEMSTMPSDTVDSDSIEPLIARDQVRTREAAAQQLIRSSGNVFVWALTASAGVSGLLFGYDTGVISSTLVSIGTDLSSRHLTNLDKGLITSCTSLFALIASPAAGVLADRVGRKNIILFSDALFIFGAIWQAFTTSVWGMILGRSIVGLAIGGASLITPLYIGELAPGHVRGRLVTVLSLFITGGQVVAYLVGWLFSTTNAGWRWMVGLGAVPSVLQLGLLFFMPETPRYLARVGQDEKAKTILKRVYQDAHDADSIDIVNDVLLAIKQEVHEEHEARARLSSNRASTLPPTLRSLLFHGPHVRALTIACLLQGTQQLCGFNSLMYFSASIFASLSFSSPTLTSLSIAITNFAFTVAAFYLIDRLGRRKILLYTIPVMIVALLLVAVAFTYIDLPSFGAPEQVSTSVSRVPAVAVLVFLVLYVASYAAGLGTVPWQQSELFPLAVRSLGSSIATATNWGSNTIVGLTFLPLMQLITPGWTFVCYAVVCAVSWTCIFFIYPETAGSDLEDVSHLLSQGWGVQESVVRHQKKTHHDHLDVAASG